MSADTCRASTSLTALQTVQQSMKPAFSQWLGICILVHVLEASRVTGAESCGFARLRLYDRVQDATLRQAL